MSGALNGDSTEISWYEGIVQRLGHLDACVVSDALDAAGRTGVAAGLRPVWEGARVVGRAVTVKLAQGAPPPDTPKVHLGVRAIERAGAFDVIVVDNAGRTEMGGWGGLLSLAASTKHVAGVVLDGACRDVDEARQLKFPVFARGGTPRTARGRVYEESCGEPVELCGIPVRTGDLVIADGSGVVVVPVECAEEVIRAAEAMAEREAGMASRLRSGMPASAVMGGAYEAMIDEMKVGSRGD